MKKKILIMTILSVALLFTACSPAESVEPVPAPSGQTETPLETATPEAATPEATQEPETQALPQTTEEVMGALLNNPQELFGEDAEQMAENTGGQFGDIEVKQPAEGYFQFASKNDGAYMSLNTRLKDFGDGTRKQQVFRMRFMPDPINNLSFTLMGMAEVVISFETDGVYCTYVQTGEKSPISDYQLEQGKWYNILLATDENAMLRVIVWEDGNYENQMLYDTDLYIGADDIFESNWQVTIGFDPGGTLNVSDYSVYTFDSFLSPPVVAGSGGEAEEAGFWSVKIGDFDAMSDGINGNVETTDLTIGGSSYTGYQLDALAAFANADASSGATVAFEDGSTENVADPADAFVIFQEDGQPLGKPYLGYNDTVSEYAITEINPN
jgi:hypothetical protein